MVLHLPIGCFKTLCNRADTEVRTQYLPAHYLAHNLATAPLVYMCIRRTEVDRHSYIYIYIYISTHTHTHTERDKHGNQHRHTVTNYSSTFLLIY